MQVLKAIELLEEEMTLEGIEILCKHYEEMILSEDIEAMLKRDYDFHTTLAAFTE